MSTEVLNGNLSSETDIIDAFEKKVKEVGVQTQVPDEIPPEMLAGSPFEERSR